MASEQPLFFKDFQVLKSLGSGGSFSQLFLAKNQSDSQFLVKKINLTEANDRTIAQSQREVEALRKVSHPNIVSFVDAFAETNNAIVSFIIVTAFYDSASNLHTAIKDRRKMKKHFDEHTVIVWFAQLTSAIEHLHNKQIMHRNLKTQSIFLTNNSKVVKLGNFGLSRIFEENDECASTIVGTPYFMAPEFFLQIPYSYKTDIWALGCVLVEAMTLRHAFAARDMYSLASRICRGELPNLPAHFSSEIRDLAKLMLSRTADERPSANAILKATFIRQHVRQFLTELDHDQKQTSETMQPQNKQLKEERKDEIKLFTLMPFNETARANRRQRLAQQKGESSEIRSRSFSNTVDNNASTAVNDSTTTSTSHNRPSSSSPRNRLLLTIPSGITALVDRNRLDKRIDSLHKECLAGLGLKRFHDAWQIFMTEIAHEAATDGDEHTETGRQDNLEASLCNFLGEEDFNKYASKIIDLKFCEDLKDRRLFSGLKVTTPDVTTASVNNFFS